ncbi:hypothetical protein MKX03_029602 [Papaver bracteatum]|nr:hypothetical protein MKX03_029602 [Papaver bracteatum]
MRSTKGNLVHFLLVVLFFSSLFILKGSAQTGETNSTDVETLAKFIDMSSGDDPCLPTPLSWVECSSDDTPRITALLTGSEPLLCYSDEDTCETDTGTETDTSPGTNEGTPTRTYGLTPTNFAPTPTRNRKKKTVPIVLGTVIPVFLIFWAIVGLLAVNHQKKKAAAEKKNGAHAPGKPMHGNEMEANTQSPNPPLPENEIKNHDSGLADENVIPDHHQVDIDQQAHPTV